MTDTIKSWVKACLDEGATSSEAIWRSCQDRFPHSCCSWGYVRRLIRQYRADVVSTSGEPNG